MKTNHLICSINKNLLGVKKTYRLYFEKSYQVSNLFVIFFDDGTFQFALENVCYVKYKQLSSNNINGRFIYRLYSAFGNKFIDGPYFPDTDSIPWHKENIFEIGNHKVFAIEANKIIPPQLIRNEKIKSSDLVKVHAIITKLLVEDPNLLDLYFPINEPKKEKKYWNW